MGSEPASGTHVCTMYMYMCATGTLDDSQVLKAFGYAIFDQQN